VRITIAPAVFSLLTTFLVFCGQQAYAVEATPGAGPAAYVDPGAVEIGEALIPPTSPLYFLKSLRENIEDRFFSPVSDESKVVRKMEFAQRRLREIRSVIKKNRQDLIEPLMQQYRNYIVLADRIAPDKPEIVATLAELKARHLDVLIRFYDEVGDPNAKRAIRASIIAVEEVNRAALGNLSDPQRGQLDQKIKLRQLGACNFLRREASGSGLNDTEKFVIKNKATECLKAF
jgi:hypothetical protein